VRTIFTVWREPDAHRTLIGDPGDVRTGGGGWKACDWELSPRLPVAAVTVEVS
jgi:hypothetical protein